MKVAAKEHTSAIEEKDRFSIALVGKVDAELLQFPISEDATAPLAIEAGIDTYPRCLIKKPETCNGGVIHHKIIVRHLPPERIDSFHEVIAVGYWGHAVVREDGNRRVRVQTQCGFA